jgi:hypothetical protein
MLVVSQWSSRALLALVAITSVLSMTVSVFAEQHRAGEVVGGGGQGGCRAYQAQLPTCDDKNIVLVSLPLRGHMMPLVSIGEALAARGCSVSIAIPRVCALHSNNSDIDSKP